MSGMTQISMETVRRAVECVKEVEGFNQHIPGVGKAYRTRARSIPSVIYETGLLSTVSFLYAKATKDVYEKVLNGNPDRPNIGSKDEVAYALYLKHLLEYLCSSLGRKEYVKQPRELLKHLAESTQELRVAQSLLKPFLVELKHVAEAALEAEEQ